MKLFGDLPHNARGAILFEPLFAVFNGMIFYYTPLYMKGIGLSETEMGLINTLNLLMAFICHFFSSPVTNRLGRRKTTLIFDMISWSIPMLIWAMAQNFWFFLAGYLINAAVHIVSVSWYCLITEDTPKDKRSRVFGILYVINFAAGVFTPLTGILITRFGTIPTMRVLYFLGFMGMTTMFLLRNRLVTETRAGRELMLRHGSLSMFESLKGYVLILVQTCRNRRILPLGLIYLITAFIVPLNFFQVIFLKEHMGFSEGTVSVIPGINALLSLLLYFAVVPKLNRYREESVLMTALGIYALGALAFVLVPEGIGFLSAIAVSIFTAGSFITGTYRDTVFMNRLGEHEKADVFSAVQTLSTLVCIPAGYIAGWLYSTASRLPFLVIALLLAAASFISFRVASPVKKTAQQTPSL